MTDEEKQLDNPESPTDKAQEGSESMASAPGTAPGTDSAQPDFSFEEDAESAALEAYAEAVAAAEAAQKKASYSKAPENAAVVEALFQETESLKSQLEDYKSQYARMAADFDNFRKRTQKEKEEQEVQIKCSTIKELLPVVDNFERARSLLKPQNDLEMNIHKSYQSVYKQMVDCLKRIGVAPMRPEGQPFDPNLHEAVMSEPTDQHPEGTVIEELVRGYILGERVLRHAMVKVATAPEPGATEIETKPEEISES